MRVRIHRMRSAQVRPFAGPLLHSQSKGKYSVSFLFCTLIMSGQTCSLPARRYLRVGFWAFRRAQGQSPDAASDSQAKREEEGKDFLGLRSCLCF